MTINELCTRREFLRYAVALAAYGIAAKSEMIVAQPSESPIVPEVKAATINGLYYGDVKLPLIAKYPDCTATLDVRIGESEYSAELRAFGKKRGDEVYTHISEGVVKNGVFLPRMAFVKMNVLLRIFNLVPYNLKNEFKFEFRYDDNGTLVELTRTQDGKSTKAFRNAKYESHTDYLTSALQQLSDLKIRRAPRKVQFVTNTGLPIDGSIYFAPDKRTAVVHLGPDFYFEILKMDFDEDLTPIKINVNEVSYFGIRIGSFEAKIVKSEILP